MYSIVYFLSVHNEFYSLLFLDNNTLNYILHCKSEPERPFIEKTVVDDYSFPIIMHL